MVVVAVISLIHVKISLSETLKRRTILSEIKEDKPIQKFHFLISFAESQVNLRKKQNTETHRPILRTAGISTLVLWLISRPETGSQVHKAPSHLAFALHGFWERAAWGQAKKAVLSFLWSNAENVLIYSIYFDILHRGQDWSLAQSFLEMYPLNQEVHLKKRSRIVCSLVTYTTTVMRSYPCRDCIWELLMGGLFPSEVWWCSSHHECTCQGDASISRTTPQWMCRKEFHRFQVWVFPYKESHNIWVWNEHLDHRVQAVVTETRGPGAPPKSILRWGCRRDFQGDVSRVGICCDYCHTVSISTLCFHK